MPEELILDPYMAPKMYRASSCVSYSQGEVGSILGALEVPFTPEKNCTYQNHMWTTTLVTKTSKTTFNNDQPRSGKEKDLWQTLNVLGFLSAVPIFQKLSKKIRKIEIAKN